MARRSLGTAILRMLGMCVIAGVALGGILSANRDSSLADFAVTAAVSTLYSALIGIPILVAFRVLGDRFVRTTARKRWLIYMAVVVSCSAGGTLVGGLVLVALDLETLAGMWAGYFRGLEVAFAIAVPSTVGAFAFGKLQTRLDDSEKSRERAVALATEARLASLESRIRPHFLFNALNSAIALIPEDPARAEKLLERLAGLLRFSLDAAHAGTIPLGEELAIVTDYLEIERVRFGDRLRFEISVPEELRALAIPAFAVQTLVENSVKYAVSARKQGACIQVTARRAGGRLVLDVSDDGPGFGAIVWVAGHGLDVLRARLDALYGAAAKLVAPAAATRGAAVHIEVPV